MNSRTDNDGADQDKKVLDIGMMVDQLYELNKGKNIHFYGDSDPNEQFLVSSINMSNVMLPLGYHYDAKKGLCLFHGGSFRVVNSPSAYDNICGHDRTKLAEHSSNRFYDKNNDAQVLFKMIDELTKTEEQCEQIDRIIALTNQNRQTRGLSKRFIDNRIVHLIKKDAWWPTSEHAFWTAGVQKIFMMESEHKLWLLEKASHELEHLARYNAVTYIGNPDDFVYTNRIGFMMFKDKKAYFKSLNEAITQEAARRTIKAELENNQYYADEWAESEKIKKQYSNLRIVRRGGRINKIHKAFADDEVLAVYITEEGTLMSIGDAYRRDRRCLKKLVNKIAKYSKQNSAAIFDLFDEATLTGNYLPVARLMHKNFGAGSFRKLAINTETVASFEKFNNKLGLMHTVHTLKQFANKRWSPNARPFNIALKRKTKR